MDGNNKKFKSDPEKFLKSKGINCKGMVRNSQDEEGGFAAISGTDIVEFDLVNTHGNMVELTVLGGVGTYAGTSRKGSPIVGHFVHWNGQTFSSGPASFGSLDLSMCTAEYVFTAPFTGCNFVITKSEAGNLKVYHEPTEDGECNYANEVILRAGPDYDDGVGVSGNGVLVRTATGWKVLVSTKKFGSSSISVKSYDIP